MTLSAISKALRSAAHTISAMAVLIPRAASRSWGFFSREDERFHLQTTKGRYKMKYWLESRGERTFDYAPNSQGTKALTGSDLQELKDAIKKDEDYLEEEWALLCMKKGWVAMSIDGTVITLSFYPGNHNSFQRFIDMRDELPGVYNKAEAPPVTADLDEETIAIRVGDRPNKDLRYHIPLQSVMFIGKRDLT
jgi:hypothetical protein